MSEGRSHGPVGTMVEEDRLHRVGDDRGVPVLTRFMINVGPGTIYVPLDGCVYRHYRARSVLRHRG